MYFKIVSMMMTFQFMKDGAIFDTLPMERMKSILNFLIFSKNCKGQCSYLFRLFKIDLNAEQE